MNCICMRSLLGGVLTLLLLLSADASHAQLFEVKPDVVEKIKKAASPYLPIFIWNDQSQEGEMSGFFECTTVAIYPVQLNEKFDANSSQPDTSPTE